MLVDATNDTEIVAVIVNDTVQQAVMMNDTVQRETIDVAENDATDIFSVATTEPMSEPSEGKIETETETRPKDAAKKPEMYFDWLDKATLVKIFGEFDAFI